MSKLVIIRGNSGSGKTTIAKEVQLAFGQSEVMLISQDYIRREMLGVKDRQDNLSIEVIKRLAEFGKGKYKFVLIEGILSSRIYKEMLLELRSFYGGKVQAFYFDVPFEETIKRHSKREKCKEFGEKEMKKWWLASDYLNIKQECLLPDNLTQEETLDLVIRRLSI